VKLKDLIKDNLKVSVSQFCREAGIDRRTAECILKEKNYYTRKDNEQYTPSLLTVKKVCKYFNVDYKDYV
jgi:DNA-binding XRE family transcriptional regulator